MRQKVKESFWKERAEVIKDDSLWVYLQVPAGENKKEKCVNTLKGRAIKKQAAESCKTVLKYIPNTPTREITPFFSWWGSISDITWTTEGNVHMVKTFRSRVK